MKLKRIVSLCMVVLFGASTAIYAGNVVELDEAKKTGTTESTEYENRDGMAENGQLEETELYVPETVSIAEVEEEKKENTEATATEQPVNAETLMAAGAEGNPVNVQQEIMTDAFDPKSLIPPGSEEGWAGQFLKYTLFYYDNTGAKQIVTKVNGDGTFLTEDLGIWLKKQDVYDISVLEEDGCYKKLLYKGKSENQQREEFEPTENTDYLPFEVLVSPGECILYHGGYTEMVDEVNVDGSFTTEYVSE